MLNELDVVRLLEPLSFETSDEGTATIPAGTEGTVLDVYDDGAAYGVDFQLKEPRFAPDGQVVDSGLYEYAFPRAEQLELVTPRTA